MAQRCGGDVGTGRPDIVEWIPAAAEEEKVREEASGTGALLHPAVQTKQTHKKWV